MWISSDSWSRIACSTGRSRNSSGWRQKNWSSASSPATYRASPVLRRPARPHIWRRLATVPGKVTQIAASRSPTSIPSSSASVATTASRSPSERRRSISRRCVGVYPARYGAIRSAMSARPASSSRSFVNRWISSTPRRDFRKQIVRTSACISSDRSCAASDSAEPRMPASSSTSGGFHITTWRSACGAPSRSTSPSSRPVSRSPSSSGFAIVALVSTKRGSVP